MYIKRILTRVVLTMAVATCCQANAFAQNVTSGEEVDISYKPHWFVQAGAGPGHTIGESDFGDLLSPAGAVNVGYGFSPVWKIRAGVSGWQAKGAWATRSQTYQYKYLQGNIDLTADLSALFCGFNPRRVFNGYAFAGAGLNHAFDNDEAHKLHDGSNPEYLWNGSKNLIAGRFGLGCDLRLNDLLSVNLECQANALSDKFNSKKAGNCDWQLNALVGLSIRIGRNYRKVVTVPYYVSPIVEPIVKETVADPVPVEKPQEQPEESIQTANKEEISAFPVNIFFDLNSSDIRDDQQEKIAELATFMRQHPETNIVLTGYADADTGNAAINLRLSGQRAYRVANALKAAGIPTNRIHTEYKGDTQQPYETPEKNRVVIGRNEKRE